MIQLLELSGPNDAEASRAVEVLERGGLVVLPRHPFSLSPSERIFLDPELVRSGVKNISLDPQTGLVKGLRERPCEAAVAAMLARYAGFATNLISALAPTYAPALQRRRTSFRPGPVETRVLSRRKDDRRLHVDAFPSNPVQGRRILRVFTNVDPQQRPRVWEVGEDGLEALIRRYDPPLKAQGLVSWSRRKLGLTKERSSAYDVAMLSLHDRAKLDDAWQVSAPRRRLEFPAGASWIVFTDGVLHAALEGQNAFEQTWLLPVHAMAAPELAPLAILERNSGRVLS